MSERPIDNAVDQPPIHPFVINPASFRLQLLAASDILVRIAPGLSAIYRLAAQFCRGEGVDVGCVSDKICEPMPGAKPVDPVIPDSGTAEHIPYPDGSQDFVFSSHCWEHCPYPEAVAREAHRVLKPGGVLFLYLPFPGRPDWDPALNEEVRAVHRWQPDPSGLGRLLLFVGFTIDYLEWAADPHDSFVVIARKPDAIQRSQ